MKYTYLLINLLTILVPLSRSFEPKIRFYQKWKTYFPALFITAIFFLVWDYFKTKNGVWSFNDTYITGIKLAGLPLEEILFFITVPYACTFIYETLRLYLKEAVLIKNLRPLVLVVSAAFFFLSFLNWGRAYTWSVLFIAAIVLPLAAYILSSVQLNRFVLAYAISLLPMFVVNGLLTGIPIVVYNNQQNLGVRIGTIPVEDFLYCLILLVMNISLYEFFTARQNRQLNTSVELVSG